MGLCCFRLVIIVIAALALTGASAAAQGAHSKVNYGPTCECQFGYGGNACVAAIACGIEGGHCAKSCEPPQDTQAIH
jgi:hypothetical protein